MHYLLLPLLPLLLATIVNASEPQQPDVCSLKGRDKWNALLNTLSPSKSLYFDKGDFDIDFLSTNLTSGLFCIGADPPPYCEEFEKDDLLIIRAAQRAAVLDVPRSAMPQVAPRHQLGSRYDLYKYMYVAFKAINCGDSVTELAKKFTEHLFECEPTSSAKLSEEILAKIRERPKDQVEAVMTRFLGLAREVLVRPTVFAMTDFFPVWVDSANDCDRKTSNEVCPLRDLCNDTWMTKRFGPHLFEQDHNRWQKFCDKVNDGTCIGLVKEFDKRLKAAIKKLKWEGVGDFTKNDRILAGLEDDVLFMVAQCEKGLICPVVEPPEPAKEKSTKPKAATPAKKTKKAEAKETKEEQPEVKKTKSGEKAAEKPAATKTKKAKKDE